MRGNTARHEYEVLFYIGLTLVLFSFAASAVRRLCGRCVAVCVAVLAAGTFAWSAHQMGFVGHDAESAQRQRALVRDFEIIRRLTRGKHNVCVSPRVASELFRDERAWIISYYLAGSNIISYMRHRPQRGQCRDSDFAGYVVSTKRQQEGTLLTPDNEIVFLHTLFDMEKSFLAEYYSLVSTKPLFRSKFDGYFKDGQLIYVKAPCTAKDVEQVFWLATVPPLPLVTHVLPWHKQHLQSINFGVGFGEYGGLMFDGKCLLSFSLPVWTDVVVTGQIGKSWRGRGRLPTEGSDLAKTEPTE